MATDAYLNIFRMASFAVTLLKDRDDDYGSRSILFCLNTSMIKLAVVAAHSFGFWFYFYE